MPKWDFACWTRGHPSSLHRGVAVTGGRPAWRTAPCALPAPSRGPTRHLGCLWHGRGPPRGWAWPAARRVACAAAISDVQAAPAQRLGRASFTHAATTGTSGPGVEPWCELHVRGGRGDSRSTRRTSKLAVGVLSWRERETAAEEPSAVASQRLPGSPSGVVLAHSEQGCALVGLCLSVCEVGVRAGGVCG